MIYLDNAATSFPKPHCVMAEVNRCIKKYCGNPGRSSHFLSLRAAEEIYSAREEVSRLFGLNCPENVVFTYNATYALNLAIKSLLTKDCHIITSDFEHNSVIRPLEKSKKILGISYSVFKNNGNLEQNIASLITTKTTGIICSAESNVTGEKTDPKRLCKIAKQYGLFLIIDASQSAGHIDLNFQENQPDALCAPGHKGLLGIQGCGFAIFKDSRRKEGIVEGGSGNESLNAAMPLNLPEGYEAGTLATPSIVSISAGIKYIRKVGLDNIENRLNSLTLELYDRLSNISGIRIYNRGTGILSFNYKSIPSSVISDELNDIGICTRSGLHCAPSIHHRLGTTEQGAVRASLSIMNKKQHIDKLYKAMKSIASIY